MVVGVIAVNCPNQKLARRLCVRFTKGLRLGDPAYCQSIIDDAFNQKLSPSVIYTEIISPANIEIGNLWHSGLITVAREHMSTQISLRTIDKVADVATTSSNNGLSIIVTSVQGDFHCVGAKMLANLLSIDGWNVYYLGYDTPVNEVAALAEESRVDAVALSVTLIKNIPNARACIKKIEGLEYPPVILIGGAAISDGLHGMGSALFASNPVEGIASLKNRLGFDSEIFLLQDLLDKIGQRISTIRKSSGTSQIQVAQQAGVDKAYISLVENGKQNLTMGALLKIAHALEVEVSDLVYPTHGL